MSAVKSTSGLPVTGEEGEEGEGEEEGEGGVQDMLTEVGKRRSLSAEESCSVLHDRASTGRGRSVEGVVRVEEM